MINQTLIPELQNDAAFTRKILERVPFDHFGWKPHEKSTPLGRLAVHIAELPGWISMTINSSELDLGKMNYKPTEVKSTEELVQLLDQKVQQALDALKGVSDENLKDNWTLRRGETVLFSMPKVSVIRAMAIKHLVHHRGQLSVYLRLLDISVPGMYGPSADEI
jgi:uncharacterized damage-inducible protein DinB